jgi:flagellar basal-body rod protein FlgF/flagellar basal-body rod protein FlgG
VAPEQAQPTASKNGSVHQGALETANQGMIPGTLNLIIVQREAEMMQKALTIFHTDFNKFATEDLPRV